MIKMTATAKVRISESGMEYRTLSSPKTSGRKRHQMFLLELAFLQDFPYMNIVIMRNRVVRIHCLGVIKAAAAK